jgi:hypothetical protein
MRLKDPERLHRHPQSQHRTNIEAPACVVCVPSRS